MEAVDADGSTTELFLRLLPRAQKYVDDAKFILSSIPNVDRVVATRAVRQLQATKSILQDVEDFSLLTKAEIDLIISFIDEVLHPLERFLRNPIPQSEPVARTSDERFFPTGRNRYSLDLECVIQLDDMGNTWEAIAESMGVTRKTLFNHLKRAGRVSKLIPYADISDEDLDLFVASILLMRRLTGAIIMQGHLISLGLRVSINRIHESLRRVDPDGTALRYSQATRRRVYKVRGSNALWHQDGNEKLKPWGFYVHGGVDGHSRLIVWLVCSNNKRSVTVGNCFRQAVERFGWPSRVRGDFGTENNVIGRLMHEKWGPQHRPYLRGRSVHNVRIERLWRDVRKDCLESFRDIFFKLEEIDMLDRDSPIHLVCLYLVYQPRIQQSLNETRAAWNNHKLRTEKYKTPIALYELSKEYAMNAGYWFYDSGDTIDEIDEEYGVDPEEIFPPDDELEADPVAPRSDKFPDVETEKTEGIVITDDEEIASAQAILHDMDFVSDDGLWGMSTYCEAVKRLTEHYANEPDIPDSEEEDEDKDEDDDEE